MGHILPYPNMLSIHEYMDTKASEYAPFDITRAPRLFFKLKDSIPIRSYNIHIIGTNGKGSTGRFIAQSLHESGFSVLHFTSPHIFNFEERYYKNGSIIDTQSLQKAHEFLQQFDFIHEASYFEYATFLALVLGIDCKYLIMEAGIGGEYDSTSIIDYNASIFTKIGIDHTQILGDSIEQIAITKLKAAKGRIFSHFQESAVLHLLQNLDSIVSCNVSYDVCYLSESNLYREDILHYTKQYNLPLFLQENLALASLFLDSLGIPILTQRLDIRGRFEILQENLIIDVGHNEMAAKNALLQMHRYSNEKFTLIYNSYKDKHIKEILEIFKDSIDRVLIFPLSHERIIDISSLIDILNDLGIFHILLDDANLDVLRKNLIESKDFFVSRNCKEAGLGMGILSARCSNSNIDHTAERYLVFGSFSLAQAFLKWYRIVPANLS